MAKIKNDPATYKKRSAFACHGGQASAKKMSPSQQAVVLKAIGSLGRTHIPFNAILKK